MGDESGVGVERVEIYACAWRGEPTKRRTTKWTRKRWGEAMEAAFLNKAVEMGFGVAKPWGESERYDFVVHGDRMWRVQVKATRNLQRRQYVIPARGFTEVYTEKEIDFLVGYVEPEEAWYVIPVAALEGRMYVTLHPSGCRAGTGLFERYREAWNLMG